MEMLRGGKAGLRRGREKLRIEVANALLNRSQGEPKSSLHGADSGPCTGIARTWMPSINSLLAEDLTCDST
jgi:hypothetical protein